MDNNKIYKFCLPFLIISWLVTLFFVLYPFFKYGTIPNFWFLLILVGLPILMFANRLKIGNLFDFSKSDSQSHEKSATVGQQINVMLLGEESANAFAKSMSSSFQGKLSLETQSPPGSPETLDLTKVASHPIVQRIDSILLASLQILRIFYSALIDSAKQPDTPTVSNNVNDSFSIDSAILSRNDKIDFDLAFLLIQHIQTHVKNTFTKSTKLSDGFKAIETLFKLRNSIDSKSLPPLRTKANRVIQAIIDAEIAIRYLSGFIAGNWGALRVPLKKLSKNKSPS